MNWDGDRFDHMDEMWRGGHHAFGWFGIVSAALSFIFFALVIWLIYKAITKFAPNASHAKSISGKETPREILDRRLAAGEISTEEYQATRKLLE